MISDTRFTPLPIPVPPMLEKVLHCPAHIHPTGDQPARYCAFYWVLGGDEAAFEDGRRTSVGTMNNDAYLAFVRHRVVAPHLRGYNLGSSEKNADFCLVLDRNERRLYLAPVEAARQLLTQQWGPRPRREEPLRVANQEELFHLLRESLDLDKWTVTTTMGSTAQILQALHAEQQATQDMLTWLDSPN